MFDLYDASAIFDRLAFHIAASVKVAKPQITYRFSFVDEVKIQLIRVVAVVLVLLDCDYGDFYIIQDVADLFVEPLSGVG